MELFSDIFNSSRFVLLASIVMTAAMLFRNQIVLRCVFLCGSALYIVYYLAVLMPPLYDAAVASVILALATLYGLVLLLLDRSRYLIRPDNLPYFEAMGEIEPGAFRRLMRLGQRRIVAREECLTLQGVTPDRLFFVRSGEVEAEKGRHRFHRRAPLFVGEIAYMNGGIASATIRVGEGAELIEWPCSALRRATERSPRLASALDARLAKELAAKVREAVGPDSLMP